MWSELAAAAIDLIYPHNCQFCNLAMEQHEPGVICRACLRTIKFIEPPFCARCALPFHGEPKETYQCGYCADLKFQFTRAVSACAAEGIVRDTVHRFKYERQMYYAAHLEEWIVAAGWRWIDWNEIDAIVPVPLHPRKKRHREFNQAEVLAAAVSRATGRPVLPRAVRRIRDTETQTRLHRTERADNLNGAFQVRRADEVAGRRLVLVDDVFTTGATLDSCAKVLRVAGAQEVVALTVARGI